MRKDERKEEMEQPITYWNNEEAPGSTRGINAANTNVSANDCTTAADGAAATNVQYVANVHEQ